MSVITRANRSAGQAVRSFDPTPAAAQPIVEPPVDKPSEQELKALELEQLKTALLALEKSERDGLLSQLFAEELEQIVRLEKQNGYEQGFEQAEQEWQSEQQQREQAFEQEKQQTIEALKGTIETFAQTKPIVELSDESILVDIVSSAVLKIIEVQLSEGEYVGEVIRTLAEEFSGQETLELCLCSRDMHILNELNLQSLLPANMKVVEQDNLLPGSYRIHIEGGAIESKLDDKLKNFQSLLIETYNRRAEEH